MTIPATYAALNPMGFPHYTDHLGAVAFVMDMPLVFTDINHYEQCLRLYPNIKAELHDWDAFTAHSIVNSYSAVFVSDMWDATQRAHKFKQHEITLGKHLTVVHCPHGFSDKGFWFKQCVEQEVTLVYGQNMLDLIARQKPHKVLQNYVVVGNLRYAYYKQHRDRLDRLVQEDVFNRFARKQPTFLYAPTWRDSESSTTFFDAAETLLSQLPDEYNLIVKLHPNLEHDHDHMVHVFDIISRYEEKPNIVILSEYPLIYPLAQACEAYIGDRSAVGYDFLPFNKPLFFISPEGIKQKEEHLFNCGTIIKPQQSTPLFSQIEQALISDKETYGAARKELCQYTFAAERPIGTIRQEIAKAIAKV